MGPQNGLIGDSSPVELPETQIDDTQFNEMQKTARFSKSKEYQDLKRYLEGRIEFYQQYLPNGQAIGAAKPEDIPGAWVAANVIVGEMRAIMAVYEQAAEFIKDESTRRKTT